MQPFLEKSFATDDHAAMLAASGGRAMTFFERNRTRGQFTKSASEVISKEDMQAHMPPDNHFAVHLITMGAEEPYGPNRNGDSASIEALSKYQHTFEKYGHVYREHKNRDPRTQGVGVVKLARYNPKMHRGELIAWVEKDKAPDMYKKASDGEELSWSMSMRLPNDECSCCKKKSRTTADYCDHLGRNMLKWIPGFEKFAYARNEEDVKFFDISEVKRRADRIATYLRYMFPGDDMLAKAASEGHHVITGADWAVHQFGALRAVPLDPWEALTLEKLAAAATFVEHSDRDTLATLASMMPQNLSAEHIEELAQPDFRSVGGELAKRAMILNFPTFASVITGRTVEDLEKCAEYQEVASNSLPSLLFDMFRSGGSCCGEAVADAVAPDEMGCAFGAGKDPIDKVMSDAGDRMGMTDGDTAGRALSVTIIKKASVTRPALVRDYDPFFEGLAQAYGHYLVKAAHIAKDAPGVSEHRLFRIIAASLSIRADK